MKRFTIAAMLAATLALSACDHMNSTQQRALSGGAIGAGGGALLSGLTGGNMGMGALLGGGGGALLGAVTAPSGHHR